MILAMDQGAKEWAMDVRSGAIEGAMDQQMGQGVMDGSRRNSKEGASCSSER